MVAANRQPPMCEHSQVASGSARPAPPPAGGRAPRSRCRAGRGCRPGAAARRSAHRSLSTAAASSRSSVTVPVRTAVRPGPGVHPEPPPPGARAGRAAGPADQQDPAVAAPRPGGGRADHLRVDPRLGRAATRPHGPGCSTSNHRSAGGAVPSRASPAASAISAQRGQAETPPVTAGRPGPAHLPAAAAGPARAGRPRPWPGRHRPTAARTQQRVQGGARRAGKVISRSGSSRRRWPRVGDQPVAQARCAAARSRRPQPVQERGPATGRTGSGRPPSHTRPRTRRAISSGPTRPQRLGQRVAHGVEVRRERGRIGHVDAQRQRRRAARGSPGRRGRAAPRPGRTG